jgi:hypothetical protein
MSWGFVGDCCVIIYALLAVVGVLVTATRGPGGAKKMKTGCLRRPL